MDENDPQNGQNRSPTRKDTPTALCDNECAVGLANKTMTPRLSKSIDMRFHWLQDRIQRGQFRLQHVAGDVNIADFFTKALPRIKHAQFAPYCALDPADLGNGPLTLALFCSYM